MYKVEKNVPIKPITRNGVPQHKYPFYQMAVGDMFRVPVDPATALGYVRVRGRVVQAVIAQHKRVNYSTHFITRTDKVNNCICVWRTA
jgi:hypothetical protein